MRKPEKLPKGFYRTPAMSLRVQVRCKGHKTEIRSFPLLSSTPHERQRQRDEAEPWAVEIRRQMHAGVFVSSRGAEAITLGDAPRRYEKDKLDPNDTNQRRDINRIRQILGDPIADRSIALLRPTDVAAYRDFLIERGWVANVAAAHRRATNCGADRHRLRDIDRLPDLRRACAIERDNARRRGLMKELEEIQRREGVATPAKTTISNKTQLITRAAKHLGPIDKGRHPNACGGKTEEAAEG